MLLKAYNENLRDCNRIMQESNCSSVGELCDLFKTMVHIQAMWDLEQRLRDEKQKIVDDKDMWFERFTQMKENYTKAVNARNDFEGRFTYMVRENEAMCKFFIAQFPEAEQLRMRAGKLYIADEDGKTKEASLKHALLCLRANVTEMHGKYHELHREHEKVKIQVAELSKGAEIMEDWQEQEYFTGLGNGPDVPEALQFVGNVKNKNMSMSHVEKTVKEMLNKRRKQEEQAASKGLVVELPDMWTLVKSQAHSHGKTKQAQAEWSYSLYDALKKYRKDNWVLRLFLEMLAGRAHPHVYFEATSLPTQLFDRAEKKDKDQRLNGRIPRRIFTNLVENFFKPVASGGSGLCKDQIKMDELLRTLKTDEIAGVWGVSAKEVEYKKLFGAGKDGGESAFILGLQEQFVEDTSLYMMDIILHMERCRRPNVLETHPKDLMNTIR